MIEDRRHFGSLSRRSFLAISAAAPFALASQAHKHIPVGIELYSVRDELAKDLMGTVRAVAKMGYEVVEFFSPYYQWTPEYAKEVRKLLDDLNVKCPSTHNGSNVFTPEGLDKAIELNRILGCKYIVMASAGRVSGLDGWKTVAERLTWASEKLKPLSMRAGFHNHRIEFVAIDGKRPMDVLAENTPKEMSLQLDVGTCLEAGVDPVSWIKANPGRINSIHCKEWSSAEGVGYKALLGEGDAKWKDIFAAAESVGGVEFYLIEQEGSRFSSLETAERCLATWKKLRA
ncbi:MAG: sugar phosphate isomerase/epimerase [Acidobacteria bacterium]|nr:sugar phosphate isomerase/epimerase [Acidobacteriota bacterium]MCW5967733.1 sugar phosphate isomerase/epimerase [Blastocatellales bacterium]